MYNFNENDQIEVLKWFCIAAHISEGSMYVNCRLCGCSSTPCYQCFNGAEKWSVIEVVSQLVDTSLQQWFKQAVNTVGGIFTPGPHSQLTVLLLFRSRSFVPLSCAYHVMQVLPFNSNTSM